MVKGFLFFDHFEIGPPFLIPDLKKVDTGFKLFANDNVVLSLFLFQDPSTGIKEPVMKHAHGLYFEITGRRIGKNIHIKNDPIIQGIQNRYGNCPACVNTTELRDPHGIGSAVIRKEGGVGISRHNMKNTV